MWSLCGQLRTVTLGHVFGESACAACGHAPGDTLTGCVCVGGVGWDCGCCNQTLADLSQGRLRAVPAEDPLARLWPLRRITITTPLVTLRYPDDADLAALAEAASAGDLYDQAVQGRPLAGWVDDPADRRARGVVTHHWQRSAEWSTCDWGLGLAVVPHGERAPVGTQSISAVDFGVTRSVSTGSWLRFDRQGQGIGAEMRAAVLHFAFVSLGALAAVSGAFEDNPRSLGVTRRLGYQPNGYQIKDRDGVPAKELLFVLERDHWQQRDDIVVDGVDDALAMFGAVPVAAGQTQTR